MNKSWAGLTLDNEETTANNINTDNTCYMVTTAVAAAEYSNAVAVAAVA